MAAVTAAGVLGNNTATANENISFTDVNIIVQRWPSGSLVPSFTGLTAGSLVTYTLKAQGTTRTLKP